VRILQEVNFMYKEILTVILKAVTCILELLGKDE